jgi:membrane-bound lytic murein transglycosylase D
MRLPFFLLLLALAGAAQAQTTRPHPDVPAAMDVAGLHLEINEAARTLIQQRADALCRHQPSFQARVDLADGSFPIIDQVLQQEGVPLDFRYLVLQESALRGDAQSIHEAVGYWQMKKGTATELGLLVNDQVDERRHLTASTRAAARYLTRNNSNLHNWLNALLSYNTGAGGVKPYVLPTDNGATEMNITEQTSPYVLMFLAHRIAFEPACGMNPKPPLRLREFPAVAGQTLAEQAQTIYADPAALAIHNRWLLAETVPADRPYTLIVPITDAAAAAGLAAGQRGITGAQLITAPTLNAKNKAEVRVNNLRALIALPNESKEDLARRGDVHLGHFLRFNELHGFDGVVAGRPYFLQNKRDVAAVEYYVVQPNESVADVAQKYGIRRKAIQSKNHLAKNEELRTGRVLWLQHTRPREVAVEYRNEAEGVGLELPVGTARPARPVARVTVPVVAPALPRAEPETVRVAVPRVPPAPVVARPVEADDAPDIDAATEALNSRPAAPEPGTMPAPRPLAPTPDAPLKLPPPVPLATGNMADEPREEAAPPRPVVATVVAKPAAPVMKAEAPRPVAAPLPKPLIVAPPKPSAVAPAVAVTKPVPAKAEAARPKVPDGSVLVAYQPVARPSGGKAAPAPAPAPKEAPKASAAGAADELHRVEPGETIYALAKRYELRPADLLAWNNLPPNSGLQVGQTIRLRPLAAAPAAAPAPRPVAPADETATTPRPASKGNPALYVPPAPKAAGAQASARPAAEPTAAPASGQHTVVAKETLYSISRLYNVTVDELKSWNNKTEPTVKIGEVLRVKAQ